MSWPPTLFKHLPNEWWGSKLRSCLASRFLWGRQRDEDQYTSVSWKMKTPFRVTTTVAPTPTPNHFLMNNHIEKLSTYIVLRKRHMIISTIMKECTSIGCLNIIFGMITNKYIVYPWPLPASLKVHVYTKWISNASLTNIRKKPQWNRPTKELCEKHLKICKLTCIIPKEKKNLLTDCSLACPPKELKFRERSQHQSL